jgi:divalent metal cation (Fe/Co/Zn/Cd) transporter
MTMTASSRPGAVRRGRWLTWTTLGYNSLEGLLSVGAGVVAGSVALIGFGVDSFIEVTASVAALWRLRLDAEPARRGFAERRALGVIGVCFLALAAYVAVDAARSLLATTLGSRAIRAEARQTDICMYLSAILLGGLALNALFAWWWADPLAALAMVPFIVREGREALRGRAGCDDCAA